MQIEIPPVLFRITNREKLVIEDGYILPHYRESQHGLSLPVTDLENLLFTAHWLSHHQSSDVYNSDQFLLLQLRTGLLKNIRPNLPFSTGEYFAKVPVSAMISILEYRWAPDWKNHYDKGEGDTNRCWQVLSHFQLAKLIRNQQI